MVRSLFSPRVGAAGVAATVAAGEVSVDPPVAGLLLDGVPVVAGADVAGLLVWGVWSGGFGAKNFAQSRITMIESAEAIKMRISGRKFFP